MIILKNILIRFPKKPKYPILLGRWNLKYDEKMINRTVYLANEDHCGCCHIEIDYKKDEYYYPFIL